MDPCARDRHFPAARVFCNDHLMRILQLSPHRPFADSKTLVDLPLRLPVPDVLARAEALPPNPTRDEYEAFLADVFHLPSQSGDATPPASLVACVPADCDDAAPRFTRVPHRRAAPRSDPDKKLRARVASFAHELKRRWPLLCRATSEDAALNGRTSAIGLPHPLFVPGGRFEESYYWDSLFVVHGLLACDMVQSALGMARNLFSLVDRFGFVPNGTRVYYLTRSQPPVLADIVAAIADHLPERERVAWVREALPRLECELEWFAARRAVSVINPGSELEDTPLAQYYYNAPHARPESFREDERTAARLRSDAGTANGGNPAGACRREALFRHLGAAAESGWDFSSRWFPPPRSAGLHEIRTTRIVPVCLNALLLRAEYVVARLHAMTEGHSGAKQWRGRADRRASAMRAHMWDSGQGAWFDVELDDLGRARRSTVVSAAALLPPRAAASVGGMTDGVGVAGYLSEKDATMWMNFAERSGLLGRGGVYATAERGSPSGEQWDWPNAWAPLVQLSVESLRAVSRTFVDRPVGRDAAHVAAWTAARFVTTCLSGWTDSGVMHEKYDARCTDGRRGGGGEYAPQTGFGWTNGVVLWLLREMWDEPEFWNCLREAVEDGSGDGDATGTNATG